MDAVSGRETNAMSKVKGSGYVNASTSPVFWNPRTVPSVVTSVSFPLDVSRTGTTYPRPSPIDNTNPSLAWKLNKTQTVTKQRFRVSLRSVDEMKGVRTVKKVNSKECTEGRKPTKG